MLGVLIVVLRLDGIAVYRRGLRECNITLVVSPVVERRKRFEAGASWSFRRSSPPGLGRMFAAPWVLAHAFSAGEAANLHSKSRHRPREVDIFAWIALLVNLNHAEVEIGNLKEARTAGGLHLPGDHQQRPRWTHGQPITGPKPDPTRFVGWSKLAWNILVL